MNEADWQRQVVAEAKAYGWIVMHVNKCPGKRITPTSIKGWPDLTLVRPPQFVLVELKGDDGYWRPEQLELMRALQACPGIEAWFAAPCDRDALFDLIRTPVPGVAYAHDTPTKGPPQ